MIEVAVFTGHGQCVDCEYVETFDSPQAAEAYIDGACAGAGLYAGDELLACRVSELLSPENPMGIPEQDRIAYCRALDARRLRL